MTQASEQPAPPDLPEGAVRPPSAPTSVPPRLPTDQVQTVRDGPDAEITAVSLEQLLHSIGVDAETVLLRHRDGTIAPPADTPQSADDVVLQALSPLQLSASGTTLGGPEYRVGKTLGEGGMGVVRVARQTALERDVAIKSVKQGARTGKAALALLREAWVMGRLEHPNVVPIHALGRDEAGNPVFVMKRIEGQEWHELIADPTKLPTAAQADPLRWHLAVLLQVCNAIAFAHSRGVLHRDLKPANVMVGPFGEVYVLDWGLAVSLDPSETRIPLAQDVADIAGTLHYMAPEMVAGKGDQLDPRSDVYLLGALLHEVLTGAPRHTGRTPMEILAAAWHSRRVDYGPEVPKELAEIANRATAFNRHDRFPSATALHDALSAFLEHRSSLTVAAAAELRLDELHAHIDQCRAARLAEASAPSQEAAPEELGDTAPDTSDATMSPAEVARARVVTTFNACRFGFQVALDSWPENPSAQAGLRAALHAMADYELDTGNLTAARALIAELATPSEALVARLAEVTQAQADERAKAARLRRMQLELDVNIGTRTRAFLALLLGLGFSAIPMIVVGYLQRSGRLVAGHLFNFLGTGGFLLAVLVGWSWASDTLNKTAFNRRVAWSLVFHGMAVVSLSVGVYVLDLEPRVAPVLSMLMSALYTAMLTATMDKRLWQCAAAYQLAFVGSLMMPAWTLEWVAFGHATACSLLAWHWRPSKLRGTYDGDATLVDIRPSRGL